MELRRPPRAAIVAVAVVLVIAAYYGIRALTSVGRRRTESLRHDRGSDGGHRPGTRRASESGAGERGRCVRAGQPLVVLDDTLLQEQRKVAAAGLEFGPRRQPDCGDRTADRAGTVPADPGGGAGAGRSTRLDDWFAKDQVEFDQPKWYFSRAEQIAAMQASGRCGQEGVGCSRSPA